MSEDKLNQTHTDDEEEEFDWNEYLMKTNSEAASATCFCQHLEPPKCEFKVGSKLETYDPRNTTSTCIGTIIEIQGPRLRLRLDGTDDRNDFWLMCDSDLIHPFEYSAKHGRKIQPPLGYGNDLSKWPKFLEKLIQSAGENVFASESCFKTPPVKPPKNEFKIGQKLEAVDPKNPHLICPATIKDINRDKLYISFDGWSQASQFWSPYTSRDLFPVGWCKRVGHTIQHPGDLEEKPIKMSNSMNITSPAPTTPVAVSSTSTKQKDTNQSNAKLSLSKSSIKQSKQLSNTNNSSSINNNNNSNNKNLNESTKLSDTSSNNLNITNEASISSPPKQPKQQPLSKSSTNKSISQNKSQKNNKAEDLDTSNKLDLSIVKNEAIDPSETENTNVTLNGTSHINPKNQTKSNVVIYVNPNGDCGNFIKTNKFHTSHTKFGPGQPSNIYKSIIQSFVDCAHDRFEVFKLIPDGDSDDFVKLKTSNLNEKKRLVSIQTVSDMWTHLKNFCKLILIDDTQLLTSKSVFNNSTNKLQSNDIKTMSNTNKNNCNNNNSTMTSLPLTPQPSSSSSTSSSASTASSENISNNNANENHNGSRLNGHKRPSSSSNLNTNNESRHFENDEQTLSKVPKLDLILSNTPITEWSIDQVVYYISQLSENYFVSYVDIFRHHEIDGKALILLSTEILIKYMGFKLGPALKLNNYLDKLRQTVTMINNSSNNVASNHNNLEQIQAKAECTY